MQTGSKFILNWTETILVVTCIFIEVVIEIRIESLMWFGSVHFMNHEHP